MNKVLKLIETFCEEIIDIAIFIVTSSFAAAVCSLLYKTIVEGAHEYFNFPAYMGHGIIHEIFFYAAGLTLVIYTKRKSLHTALSTMLTTILLVVTIYPNNTKDFNYSIFKLFLIGTIIYYFYYRTSFSTKKGLINKVLGLLKTCYEGIVDSGIFIVTASFAMITCSLLYKIIVQFLSEYFKFSSSIIPEIIHEIFFYTAGLALIIYFKKKSLQITLFTILTTIFLTIAIYPNNTKIPLYFIFKLFLIGTIIYYFYYRTSFSTHPAQHP